MEFKALHGLYDDVISLGENCYTAIHLQKYKLRKHSGPLDWFTSPDLSSINDLLKNNFINFMDLNNMYAMADKNIVFNDGVIQTVSSYIVKDIKYKITSYHDFLVISTNSLYHSSISLVIICRALLLHLGVASHIHQLKGLDYS
ncbi:hypothetical protein DYR28_29330 [Bacillus cereus]|nr:hypothetical protein DYR28_29330 [Bacillus cereus]